MVLKDRACHTNEEADCLAWGAAPEARRCQSKYVEGELLRLGAVPHSGIDQGVDRVNVLDDEPPPTHPVSPLAGCPRAIILRCIN
jgi:hypothetical protein